MGVSYGQITGIILTVISTIFVLVGILFAGVGASSEHDRPCYDKSYLNTMIATGVIGMLGHIVAAVFYLRSATTAIPASVGSV